MNLSCMLIISSASLLVGRLRKLSRVVWTRRQPLANVGAVLSLLDGPQGCDPVYCFVWFRLRLVRMYLAYRPFEVGRIYRLLLLPRPFAGCWCR